jgi:hypothetical protein
MIIDQISISIVKKMHIGTKAVLEIRGKFARGIVMIRDLRKGCNLSRIFFKVYLEEALKCGKKIFWDKGLN